MSARPDRWDAVFAVAAQTVVDGGIAEVLAEQLDARLFHQAVDLAARASVLLRQLRDRQSSRGAAARGKTPALGGAFRQLLQIGEAD